jgi:hypothetical protein
MKHFFVIVGVLTILLGVGWVIKTSNSAWAANKVNARTQRFNEDVVTFFDALQKYKENVGAYPVGSNAEIAKMLKGKNPKNVIILVGRKTELNEKGEFVDPWGTALRIYFSDNGILVRSAGPNRRFDDSTAIDCDDFFRSN